MLNDIWNVLISIEIIIITVMMTALICILNLKVQFHKRKRRKKKSTEDIVHPPGNVPSGNILVPDSTYEILMKEKKRGR